MLAIQRLIERTMAAVAFAEAAEAESAILVAGLTPVSGHAVCAGLTRDLIAITFAEANASELVIA